LKLSGKVKELESSGAAQKLMKDSVFLCNAFIKAKSNLGQLDEARRVFESVLPNHRTVGVVWRTIAHAYATAQRPQEVLDLYDQMVADPMAQPDTYVVAMALSACADLGPIRLDQGRQVHIYIEKRGLRRDRDRALVLGNALITMYR